MTILQVENLQTHFHTRNGIVKAVDGVSFQIKRGETLGIVGESGSGKSVTMMSLLGLIPCPPGKIVGGSALFDGQQLIGMPESRLRHYRGNRIAMIFQDPMTCLNPYLKISTQMVEVLTNHRNISRSKAVSECLQALERVGIPDPKNRFEQYPHQFSGGMRQRVMIAMAIVAKPDLLIADEPTTALDVTVQAQILDLIREMQKELSMSVVLITHDLGVVARMAENILVMYAGRPVELGNIDDIFYRTQHPYTQALLQSLPQNAKNQDLFSIPGLPPDTSRLPPGCAFAPRCHRSMAVCRQDKKVPLRTFTGDHKSVCHLESLS